MTYTVFDVDSRTLIGRGLSAQESHHIIAADARDRNIPIRMWRNVIRVTDDFADDYADDDGCIDIMFTAMDLVGPPEMINEYHHMHRSYFTDLHAMSINTADLKGHGTVSAKQDGDGYLIQLIPLIERHNLRLLIATLDTLAAANAYGTSYMWSRLRRGIERRAQ